MSRAARLMTGLLLILVPTIEFGGRFLLMQLSARAHGYTDNLVREDVFRAGHAHAGVIVLLSLIGQILADHAALPAWLVWTIRIALPVSAMLVSAGFFLSMPGADASQPGAMIGLVYAGAVLLALAVLTLAAGLIRSSSRTT
jgi:hypothetical protein